MTEFGCAFCEAVDRSISIHVCFSCLSVHNHSISALLQWVINIWNSLDNATACAPSGNSFKRHLETLHIMDLLQDYDSLCDPRGWASPRGEASSGKISRKLCN